MLARRPDISSRRALRLRAARISSSLSSAFVEAARDRWFEARDLVVGSSKAGGRADDAGQAQNGGEIRFGLHAELLAQILDGAQIGCRDFVVHGDGCRPGELVAQRDVEMAAPHAVANDLADARLERLEALGHAQMQIEEAMIHAAHGDAKADAVFARLRLGVAGH